MRKQLLGIAVVASAFVANGAGHVLELTERVASVEEGLLLGNGDMSASLA